MGFNEDHYHALVMDFFLPATTLKASEFETVSNHLFGTRLRAEPWGTPGQPLLPATLYIGARR